MCSVRRLYKVGELLHRTARAKGGTRHLMDPLSGSGVAYLRSGAISVLRPSRQESSLEQVASSAPAQPHDRVHTTVDLEKVRLYSLVLHHQAARTFIRHRVCVGSTAARQYGRPKMNPTQTPAQTLICDMAQTAHTDKSCARAPVATNTDTTDGLGTDHRYHIGRSTDHPPPSSHKPKQHLQSASR